MAPPLRTNGIDAQTGKPLPAPDRAALAALARAGLGGHRAPPPTAGTPPKLRLPFDVAPDDVANAGWAVVVPAGLPDEAQRAVGLLLEHRREKIAASRCKLLEWRPGETAAAWLARYRVALGQGDPTRVPHYLMLAGPPTAIPFSFQQQLSAEYAVGRLSFDGADWGRYVDALIAYEKADAPPGARRLAFWGTAHPGDAATALSTAGLLKPLRDGLPDSAAATPVAKQLGWKQSAAIDGEGTKARLLALLREPDAMLFTASHGVAFSPSNPQQARLNGALLCQDWAGGAVRPSEIVTAADVGDDVDARGRMAFCFACFGGGTPEVDEYPRDRGAAADRIAPAPFVAALPQRLLARGALAVISHVDRAWGFSIAPDGQDPQIETFRNCLGLLLSGKPAGHALQQFCQRGALLAADVLRQLDAEAAGEQLDGAAAWSWIEQRDARNYALLGDPAAALRVDRLQA